MRRDAGTTARCTACHSTKHSATSRSNRSPTHRILVSEKTSRAERSANATSITSRSRRNTAIAASPIRAVPRYGPSQPNLGRRSDSAADRGCAEIAGSCSPVVAFKVCNVMRFLCLGVVGFECLFWLSRHAHQSVVIPHAAMPGSPPSGDGGYV